jgi:hypothetical protein
MIKQLQGYERVAWCISDQQLAAQGAQGQLDAHTKVFENEIHILLLNQATPVDMAYIF